MAPLYRAARPRRVIPRRQVPVRSPLALPALLRGLGAWAGSGDEPRRALAALIRARLGARDALLTDSGTSALQLAIRGALASRSSRVVALPAWNCYDLATAAVGAGADVVLYDVDPASFAPEPASLRAALDAGAGAVVVAHLFGVPVDVGAVRSAAEPRGAVVIEDAAQAAGGTLADRPLGSLAPLAVLSFGRGKGLTGGGGGALVAADDDSAAIVAAARGSLEPPRRGTREWLGAVAQWSLARPALYAVPAALPFLKLGETVFHPPHAPRAMAAASAAATLASVARADAEVAARRHNAAQLLAALTPAFGAARPPAGAVPGWLRLPLLASDAAAAAARTPAAQRLGVAPGYPLVLADLPGFGARCRNADRAFAGARTLASRLVTLPTHSWLTPRDLDALVAWMRRQ